MLVCVGRGERMGKRGKRGEMGLDLVGLLEIEKKAGKGWEEWWAWNGERNGRKREWDSENGMRLAGRIGFEWEWKERWDRERNRRFGVVWE